MDITVRPAILYSHSFSVLVTTSVMTLICRMSSSLVDVIALSVQ